MKFKDIKNLIYSPILLIIGDKTTYPISIDNIPFKYDNFEVIGIRSLNDDSTNYEDAVVISLKEPLFINDFLDNETSIEQERKRVRYQAKE